MDAPADTESPPRDEEGLLLEYDVILAGTGLVQAILASALARAGKSVLHCDGADLYGELDAVWPLSQIKEQQATASRLSQEATDPNSIEIAPGTGTTTLQWHSSNTTTRFGIVEGTRVQTPQGKGVIKSISESSMTISMDQKSEAKSDEDLEETDSTLPLETDAPITDPIAFEEYLKGHKIQSIQSLNAQRILQDERHLCLDSTACFILAAGRAVDGMLASNVADYLEFKCIEGLLWYESSTLSRVPCSKNDVFNSKLLSPLDKRRLMKFLQLAMDYATKMKVAEDYLQENAETEVQSLNERHLNQGRSLARPQNKAVATEELKNLQKCMEQPDATFDDYLHTQHKLSPKLRGIIRYSLAMETESESISLSQGMSQLRHHLHALGRFGSTAFLMPMYGSGELSQAFCRSAAVFGATYLLRRAPLAINVKDKTVRGVLVAGDVSEDDPDSTCDNKTIQCAHVVVPSIAVPQLFSARSTTQRILRRISILNGKITEGEQRHIIVIPPQSLKNSHSIHGITLDESVQVAPVGCTLLHLTTTIENEESLSLLDLAAKKILSSKDVDEIYSVNFSHELFTDGGESSLPEGLHVCSHTGQTLTADAAFEQAERIFQQICPGKEFLGLSDELDAAIKERAAERGYEDEERIMLESALGMIGAEEPASSEVLPDVAKDATAESESTKKTLAPEAKQD